MVDLVALENKKDATMHKIFLIVGETSSGKDSLVNKLCAENNYKQLCSYTTRPKRVGEGDTHIFITDKDCDKYTHEIVAHTQIGKYQYFATRTQLKESDIYVIDYKGIQYFKSLNLDDLNLDIITIHINVPKDVRKYRATELRKDNELAFYKRCFDEELQFKEMLLKGDFDYSISNVDLDKAYKILKSIIEIETTEVSNNE